MYDEEVLDLAVNFFSWVQGERIRVLIGSSVFDFSLLDFNITESVDDLLALLITKERVQDLAVSPGRKVGHLGGTFDN